MDERSIGFFLGMVTGGILLVVIALIRKGKKNKLLCEYDERQILARGRAFQRGFLTLFFYDVFYAVIYGESEPSWCTHAFGMFLGVMLAAVVLAVYAIWNDAFMQLNQSPAAICLIFGGLGICNLLLGIEHVLKGEIFVDGKVGQGGINLLLAFAMLFVVIVFAIKRGMEKRGEE